MSVWQLALAGFGLWFLVEGLMYALAPDAMQRFLNWAARLSVTEIRQAGLWTAAFGALLIYILYRF